jgi:hypothetical protein
MAKSNEREPIVTPIAIGNQASTANAVLPGIYFRKHSRIKNVYLVDQVGVAKSNTDHVTLTLQDNSSSPVAYAALDTSAAAAVALSPLAFTLSVQSDDSSQAVSQEEDVPAGTMLNLKVVGAGVGHLTNAIALVEWYPC